MSKELDVLIIGSGPAGMTAGIYSARSKLKVLILEKELYGGQMNNTERIENYSGIKEISGQELSENMYQQYISEGGNYGYGEIEKIEQAGNKWKIYTDLEEYISKTVIIATGTVHNKLGIKGEEEFNGRGVSYCAICDGAFFKGKKVIVVGGGDSALEEGEYLTNQANVVTLLHRRTELRGVKKLQDNFLNKENSSVMYQTNLIEIKGTDKVEKVVIQEFNETKEMLVDGIFIYVGSSPNTEFIDNNLLDDDGYVITDSKMNTERRGLYAVGDVRSGSVRQIATAVGDGAVASLEIYKYIQEEFI